MRHFVKSIETSYGIFNFYINEIETAEGTMIHISVIGKDKKPCMFMMERHLNRWYLKNPVNCPDWIINIEPILSDEIGQVIKQ
ncbi:MAG: hypothetical protein ACJ748_08855 [Flavisolibacter sp.]